MRVKPRKSTRFKHKKIDPELRREHLELDLPELYKQASQELALQQTKRDQIIAIYLAIFSFLIPAVLSNEELDWRSKGLLLLAASVVGILFAFVIVRYRVYKEVYWLCCQSITTLFSLKTEALTKQTIQSVFFETMYKKGKSFMVVKEEKKKKKKNKNKKKDERKPKKKAALPVFDKKLYVKKSLFSAESIYYFIHIFITCLIFGLSIGLILPFGLWLNIALAAVSGLALSCPLLWEYFSECIKVYQVLIDGKDESFNATYKKAWFLHFFV